jgi:thiosulfate/3-mercaptopyruvate sulfurtransferase
MNRRYPSATAAARLLPLMLAIGFCQLDAAWAAGRSAMLISPDAVQKGLNDKSLRLLDIRPEEEYLAGHIPGAVRLDLDEWKTFAKTPGALHDASGWTDRVGAVGIGPDTEVVIYGGELNEAARAWWILKYLGHGQVRLLDGDWQTWTTAPPERPVETDVPEVAKARFTPRFQPDRLAEIDQVKNWVSGSNVAILDARTEGEYTGAEVKKGNPRGGRLPQAIHLNWENLRRPDGRFKGPGRLKKMFEAASLNPDRAVVTYCQSGGRAAAEAFALELAGFEKVRNYYCSFQQWSADGEVPVVKDEQPAAEKKE